MGYFRSIGLKTDQGNYILYQKLEAPYYHPLPAEFRNPRGDYKLSPSIDDRFWSKMDFEHRPVTIKMLETTITLTENNGSNELTFKTTGSDNVAVTIELCFREGGKLTGVIPQMTGKITIFLKAEMPNMNREEISLNSDPDQRLIKYKEVSKVKNTVLIPVH
jgi:hypothetical protein